MGPRFATLAVVLCCACTDDTSILLTIDGDLEPGVELRQLTLSTFRQGAQTWSARFQLEPGETLPSTYRILPSSGEDEAVELVVESRLEQGGELRVIRQLGFVRGREVPVQVCLWRACVDSVSESCLAGACEIDEADGDADADQDALRDGDRSSDGDGDGEADDAPDVDRCTDGARSEGETDVDCGGSACEPCSDFSACTVDSDCESGLCAESICAPATCANGALDGDETAVDCGGGAGCPPCADFRTCAAASDCASSACMAGRCGTTACSIFGTDGYGYAGCAFTPAAMPCPDIGATGTSVTPDDNTAVQVPLGFDFDFYGIPNRSVGVNTNGGLVFVRGRISYVIECFPVYVAPEHIIAAYWDDLIFRAGSSIVYETVGVEPSRSFVVHWNVEHRRAEGNPLEFTVVLEETTNDIVVCYHDTSVGNVDYDGGRRASIGVNGTDEHQIQLSCMTVGVHDGLVTRYIHP